MRPGQEQSKGGKPCSCNCGGCRKIKTADGKSISLDQFKGQKAVVLFFFPKVLAFLQDISLHSRHLATADRIEYFWPAPPPCVGSNSRVHQGSLQVPG